MRFCQLSSMTWSGQEMVAKIICNKRNMGENMSEPSGNDGATVSVSTLMSNFRSCINMTVTCEELTHLFLVPHICQWTGSALVQVMACCLFGNKPLPELMLACCQLDSWEQISVKFESEFYHFRSRNCIWNCRLPKWWPFSPGGDELTVGRNSYIHIRITIFHVFHFQSYVNSILT